MERKHEQLLMQQLEATIEHSHQLQLKLVGLIRVLIDVEPELSPHSSDTQPLPRPASVDLPDKPMFSVEEAAKLLGVGRSTAYQCARNGQIPALRLGSRLLIPKAAMERLLSIK